MAVKQSDSAVSLTNLYGKGLISSFEGDPSNAFSEKYKNSFVFKFNSDGTARNSYGWDYFGEGYGSGWVSEVDYAWERSSNDNTLIMYSCSRGGLSGWQDTDSDGAVDTCPSPYILRFRTFELLSATDAGVWAMMEYYISYYGGQLTAVKNGDRTQGSAANLGSVYLNFWAKDDRLSDNDFDADNVKNDVDRYPFVAIGDLVDTDADGAPDECDAACVALGMAADDDDDGDGVVDGSDAFPLDSNESVDTDGDGVGNNADNDDDNDGQLDADDESPLDAFPWDDDLTVAKTIDQSSFPSIFLVATKTADDIWQYSSSRVGSLLYFSQDKETGARTSVVRPNGGVSGSRDVDASFQSGTWSFGTNSVRSSDRLPQDPGYFPAADRTGTRYTNIDWDEFEASGAVQLSLKVQYDREYWLVDSDAATGRYTYYQKETVSYFVADDVSYAIDSSKPVEVLDPTYEKLTLVDLDSKTNLPFTSSELVTGSSSSWALPIEINEQSSSDDTYLRPTIDSAIITDVATFNSDGTGSTQLGGRTFTWEEVSTDLRNPFIKVTYESGATAYIYKFAEGSEHISVRVLVSTPAGKVTNTYHLAIKQSDSAVSLTNLYGKGLIASTDGNPNNAFAEKYKNSFVLSLNSDGTARTYYGWDSNGNGLWGSEVDYAWERSGNDNTLIAYSCASGGFSGWQDTDSDGAVDTCPSPFYLRFRTFELLSATDAGVDDGVQPGIWWSACGCEERQSSSRQRAQPKHAFGRKMTVFDADGKMALIVIRLLR